MMGQPALTDEERLVWQARLIKAETALDDLLTGKAVKRFVDQNGETVEYTAAEHLLLSPLVNVLFSKKFL